MPVSGSGNENSTPAAALVEAVEKYLSDHPHAAVMEDGRVLFDLRSARYSVAESHGRCVLQFWSEERNVVRTVVEMRHRANSLRLMTRRMGAAKLSAIELVPGSDLRTPTAREAGRRQYLKRLERVLARAFPDWKADGMRAATDLEHSFGPAYARGHLLRGTTAEAVIGVGCDESSATIDGILTLGLLWLDYCREHSLNKRGGKHYGGLKVIVPQGAAQTAAERMVWLNHSAAAFRLFTLEERSEELIEVDFRDAGNVQTRLTHGFDAGLAMERARPAVDRVLALVPVGARTRVELRVRTAAEVSLQLHGLDFARVRMNASSHPFAQESEITFGASAHETRLDDETEPLCRELLARLFASRRPDGEYADPLFRLQPERWLESLIRMEVEEFLPGLREEYLYSQVPAIASGERGMLDLLTLDREGRLTVIEIKADEDMHLPLQALDYWIRVRQLNADRQRAGNRDIGMFERQGYFTGAEVAPMPPKLLLIAPALRIHPSNETVLRYLSSEVEWELIAVSEHWRRELKVVFRKRGN